MPGQPPPFTLASQAMPSEGMQWELPRRPWGAGWFIPWIAVAIGITVAAIFGINGPITLPNFNKDLTKAIFDTLSLLGDLAFSLGGLAAALAGFFLMHGKTTVTLRAHEVTSTDHFGPLHWTRRIKTVRITGFEISVGTTSTNGGPSKPTENVTLLVAKTDLPSKHEKGKTKDFYVAWAYPKAWMQELADALTVNAADINPRLAELEVTTKLEFEDDENEKENPVQQPTDSKTTLTRDADSLTFNIPPGGYLRGSKGLGCFAVMWNVPLLTVFGFLLYSNFFTGQSPSSNQPPLIIILFMLPFLAVGFGLAMFATHLGKSKASIVVIGSGQDAVIAYHRISPVRKPRELTWSAAELSHIRVDDSNMSVNDEPVKELQIHPRQGKKVGLLAQLDNEELDWIAYELRQQTGLKRRSLASSND